MIEKYKIIEIAEEKKDSLEQLGTKAKFWYYEDGKKFLFNPKNSSNVKKVVPKKGANIYFSVS